MMQSTSPRVHSEPLLRDEMPTGPRLGAYAPPPSSSSQSSSRGGDSFDLQLTATDSIGQVIPIEEEEEDGEPLPALPPLISYCSYVRFGCAFGKWILLVLLINVIAIAICVKAGYFGYGRLWPLNSWQGWLLATVWFLTSVWFYLSAKIVDKEVQMMNRNYEPGRLSEDDAVTPSFVPNYEHIYGQVSRKIDTAFHSPNEPTSSLINLSLALWAVALAAAVFLGTGLAWGKHYQATCDHTNLPNGTSSKGDFANIQSYPEDVQTWIAEQTDPWGGRYRIEPSNDDYNTDDGMNNNNNNRGGDDGSHSFPTAYSIDYGIFATMPDGTVFFAGQPLDDNYQQSKYLVLVESPGTGGPPIYHTDIRNPRMFIPVAKTASKNDNGNWIASQYCFTASKDPAERKKSRRSWDSIIRTTPICCITTKTSADADKASSFEFTKSKLVWTDKIQPGAQVSAASTGNEILVAHTGVNDGSSVFQEVVSVNPNTMESKIVYHLTTSQQGGYHSWYDGPRGSETVRCIQSHVQVGSAVASMVVMVLSGLWLIFREGVPVGVSPILLAVVSLIRLFTGEWDSGLGYMALTLGTFFFHGVLACGNICPLPAWMGRDMHVWALYSWISSFIIMDVVFRMGGVGYLATAFLGISGIILNHPVPQIIGYFYVIMGIWYFLMFPFFRYYWGQYLLEGSLFVLVGIGIIGLSTCLSNNRRYCVAACRPISRAGRTMFYGAHPPSSSSSMSRAPRGATPTTSMV